MKTEAEAESCAETTQKKREGKGHKNKKKQLLSHKLLPVNSDGGRSSRCRPDR